jgi:nucleoside-diphosphate-sugar epimerase
MSVLLVGLEGDLGRAVAARLVEQGDLVRAVTSEPDAWPEHVFVADARQEESDLIERAAQGVRSIVVTDRGPTEEVIAAAGVVGARLIVLVPSERSAVAQAVAASGVDHVILALRRSGLLRKRPSVEEIAGAIDAADDMSGNPRLVRVLR